VFDAVGDRHALDRVVGEGVKAIIGRGECGRPGEDRTTAGRLREVGEGGKHPYAVFAVLDEARLAGRDALAGVNQIGADLGIPGLARPEVVSGRHEGIRVRTLVDERV
jgi:hypothetical protein